MKKEVLFMMDSLTCGGAEKSLVSLLPLLDYDKVNVTLLLFARGGVFECYVPDQVKVIKLDLPSNMRIKMSLWGYSLQIRKNKLFGKKEHLAETYWKCLENSVPEFNKSYDIAIAYQQGFPTYYVAEKVSAAKKYAWVNVDLKKAGYGSDFNSKIYEKYDKVVAVSDAVSDYLISQKYVTDKSKIVVVYDILNTELIRSMSKKQGFKDDFDGTRLVTVGRMVPQKAYDLAVMAADELKSRGFRFKWSFVGNGSDRPKIEKMISDRHLEDCVELLGEQSNPYPYMAACDIYVQTSRFEGFGLTVTEARILGKAEVCTNFPSAYNQIVDGENGLICEMDPKSIADKIALLLTNKDLKNHLESIVAKEVNRTAETEGAKVRALLS